MGKRRLLTSLISLRFFFALRVYASHLKPFLGGNSKVYDWIYENVLSIPFGVSFFYILSGFVLSYSYRDKILLRTKKRSEFFIDRLIRIYPLHLITFFLVIPVSEEFYYMGNMFGWIIKLFSQVTLLQSFVPIKSVYFSYNGPSWSLSNALFFYAIFPIVIFILNRLRFRRYVFIITILFLIILPFLMDQVNQEFNTWIFYVNPLFRSIDFIIGIILFSVYIKTKHYKMSGVVYSLIEIVSILIFVGYIGAKDLIPEVIRDSYGNWLPLSIIILAFSYGKGFLSNKILNKKVFVLLGNISFGIFIFHGVVLRYFKVANNYLTINDPLIIVFITFTLTVVFSFLSAKYIERPLGSKIKRDIYYYFKRCKSMLKC